jgi:hypothetical protein
VRSFADLPAPFGAVEHPPGKGLPAAVYWAIAGNGYNSCDIAGLIGGSGDPRFSAIAIIIAAPACISPPSAANAPPAPHLAGGRRIQLIRRHTNFHNLKVRGSNPLPATRSARPGSQWGLTEAGPPVRRPDRPVRGQKPSPAGRVASRLPAGAPSARICLFAGVPDGEGKGPALEDGPQGVLCPCRSSAHPEWRPESRRRFPLWGAQSLRRVCELILRRSDAAAGG